MELTVPAVLPPCQISSVDLTSYSGQHLAILFYPYDFLDTPFQELRDFADKYQEFQSLNCQVTFLYRKKVIIYLLSLIEFINYIPTAVVKLFYGSQKITVFMSALKYFIAFYPVMSQDKEREATNLILLIIDLVFPLVRYFSIREILLLQLTWVAASIFLTTHH